MSVASHKLSKDPQDIEVRIHFSNNYNYLFILTKLPFLFDLLINQNLLKLNPVIKSHASLVPTVETKKQRKYWKRNLEKNCTVFICFV